MTTSISPKGVTLPVYVLITDTTSYTSKPKITMHETMDTFVEQFLELEDDGETVNKKYEIRYTDNHLEQLDINERNIWKYAYENNIKRRER